MKALYVPDHIPRSLHLSSVECCPQFVCLFAQQFLCVFCQVSFCPLCCSVTDTTAMAVSAEGSCLCVMKHIMVAERFCSKTMVDC